MFRYVLLWMIAAGLPVFFANQQQAQAQNQTDIAVTSINLPPATVPYNQPIAVEFTLQNLGNAPAENFFCEIRIVNPSAPIDPLFQDQVNVEFLDMGETSTLSSTQNWMPETPGNYVVQVAAVFELDNSPTNNFLDKEFVVEEPNDLLTLAEAVNILNQEVLDNHPRVEELVALHLSPPENPADSLVPPGLLIEAADGSLTLQYEFPVYFFFVDYHPEMLYGHLVEYITVNATDGTVDRSEAQIWPEIDGVTPEFGPACFDTPNARRVRGNGRACAPKANPYQLVNTDNDSDWAIAVVGKLNLDVEKTTVQQDLCNWKERLNGNPFGPQIDNDKFIVNSGQNNCGLTEQELCTAIEQLKDQACRKVYFKYIGHGIPRGIALWDSTHRRTKILTWEELACKLKDVGVREACIEITSCHSGASIDDFSKKGIKGSIITSSSSGLPTFVGDGSGTYWEKALDSCSRDSLADLNRNRKIDNCELFAWVRINAGDSVNSRMPQIKKLNDTIKGISITSVGTPRGQEQNMSTDNGPLIVYVRGICVRLDRRRGRDSVVYRRAVYIENPVNFRRSSNRKRYHIIAVCGTNRRNRRIDTLVRDYRPNLGPKERICIANWPEDCRRFFVVEAPRNSAERKEDENPTVLSAISSNASESLDFEVIHSPGSFGFYRYIFDSTFSDDQHISSITGPQGWDLTIEPNNFFVPSNTAQDVFTGIFIPDSATSGGTVSAVLANTGTNDSLELRYNVFLQDTLRRVTTTDQLQSRWRSFEAVGSALLKGFGVSLENTRINVRDSLEIESVGDWNWSNVYVNADSGALLTVKAGLGGSNTRWEDVGIRGATSAVLAEGSRISMRDVSIAESGGDGIVFRGVMPPNDSTIALVIDTLESLTVVGPVRNGIVFDNLSLEFRDTLWTHNLRVEMADSNDIVVTNNSHVWCFDCEYDEAKVSVDQTSTLMRLGTVSFMAVDTSGTGLPGIDIEVRVMQTGATAVALPTDANGFLPAIPLPFSLNQNGSRFRTGPFEIIVSRGTDIVLRDTIDPIGWTQRVYVIEPDISSAPVSGERTSGAAITAVVPQPYSGGATLDLETTGLGTRTVAVSLHTTLGETVWNAERVHVRNDRIKLHKLNKNLEAGFYILRLHLANGEFLSTKVIVR